MKADFSRVTFRSQQHYRQVRFEQGKIPLDSELNESQDIALQRIETETTDVVGRVGVPLDNAGFGISVVNNELEISAGRIYVDGLMCTLNEAERVDQQSNYPGAEVPAGAGVYLAYLDAWSEYLNWEDDALLREVALLGVRTAGRGRLVPQVKLLELSNDPTDVQECNEPAPQWDELITPPSGRLAARAEPQALPEDECSITPGAGYRRLENQLYRVEVHESGDQTTASFKWSRENGSVLSLMLQLVGDELTLAGNSRDRLVGFSPGDWIEVIDRRHELDNEPGSFVRIREVDENLIRVDLASLVGAPLNTYATAARVRRWESHAGAPLRTLRQGAGGDGYVVLEDGVEVRFSTGTYEKGDYWFIPARTVTGDVEWPQDNNQPAAVSRHGVHHHFAKLAILINDGNNWSVYRDCRVKFPPLTRQRSCSQLYVGDGVHSIGDFDSLAEALANLPIDGGTVTLLPGEHAVAETISNRSNITIIGCGRQSRVVPRGNPLALLRFVDCSGIRMTDVALEHRSGFGVLAAAKTWQSDNGFSMERCSVLAARSALVLLRVRGVRIEHCAFKLLASQHGEAAVALACINARVGQCAIQAGHGNDLKSTGWGGVHLLSGCSSVTLHDNDIAGGLGNGITFGGSLADYDWAEKQVAAGDLRAPAEGRTIEMPDEFARLRVVDEKNQPVDGVPVSIAGARGAKVMFAGEDETGWIDTGQGSTKFYVGGGHRIVDARPDRETDGTSVARLIVTKHPTDAEVRVPAVLATGVEEPDKDRGAFVNRTDKRLPISGITIERNRIGETGLSGIGVLMDRRVLKMSSLAWKDSAAVTAPIDKGQFATKLFAMLPTDHALLRLTLRNVTINDNHIYDTFRAPASFALGGEELGFGGITLPSVHDLVIRGNVIEGFGDGRAKPSTGIFVVHAAGLVIQDNVVRADPIDRNNVIAPAPGYRGGIVVRLAMQSMNRGKVVEQETGSGRVAIVGNEVDVQVGRAMTLLGLGQIQVKDNLLKSNRTADRQLDQLAGNALVINLGGLAEMLRLLLLGKPKPATPGAVAGLGVLAGHNSIWGDLRDSDKVTASTVVASEAEGRSEPLAISNLTAFTPREAVAGVDGRELTLQRKQFAVDFQPLLFGAGTQFHGNQMMLGPENQAWSSHIIFGLGDVAYDDNQSTTYQRHALPVNAGLGGSTVRANNSRFAEAHVAASLSLAAGALGAVNALGNHADHCLLVKSQGFAGLGVRRDNNQVLDKARCKKMSDLTLSAAVGRLVALTQVATAKGVTDDIELAVTGRAEPISELITEADALIADEGLRKVNTALAASAVAGGEADYFAGLELGDDTRLVHARKASSRESADIVGRLRELKGVGKGLLTLRREDEVDEGMVVEGRLNLAGLDHDGGTKVVLTNGTKVFETKTLAGGFYRLHLDEASIAEIPDDERSKWRVLAQGSDGTTLSETPDDIELKPNHRVVTNLAASSAKLRLAVPGVGRRKRPTGRKNPSPSGKKKPSPTKKKAKRAKKSPTRRRTQPTDDANPLTVLVGELDGFTERAATRLYKAGFDTLAKVERGRNADLKRYIGRLNPTELKRAVKKLRGRE